MTAPRKFIVACTQQLRNFNTMMILEAGGKLPMSPIDLADFEDDELLFAFQEQLGELEQRIEALANRKREQVTKA